MTLRRAGLVYWIIVITVLLIDQATKYLVLLGMPEGASIPLIEGVFHLTHVQNLGAAFGLLPGRQPLFIATNVIVLVVIAAYWRRSRPTQLPIVLALALITGGSVGNAIDRLWRGSVTDFFDFTLIDFPVFNIADSAILTGVAILIGWLLFVPEPATAPGATIDDPGATETGELSADGADSSASNESNR